jgi:hypothetical protein
MVATTELAATAREEEEEEEEEGAVGNSREWAARGNFQKKTSDGK